MNLLKNFSATSFLFLSLTLFSTLLSTNINAKNYEKGESNKAVHENSIKLSKLIAQVEKNIGKQFLVHSDCPAQVTGQGVDLDNINFDQLLTLIDLNHMAAVESNGVVSIVPVDRVKQYPIPMIADEDKVEHEFLWVSKIIKTDSRQLNMMIPILRSLVRTNGHMASHAPSGSIILVAPYYNVVRIEKMIKQLVETTNLTPNS